MFDDLAEMLRNPEEILRAHNEQLVKAEELQQALESTRGSAASQDERIFISYSQNNGIEELRLDPRVLRMASDDLAGEIQRLVNEARADVERQRRELIAANSPDPDEVLAQLPAMQQSLDEMMRDTRSAGNEITDLVDRVRRLFPAE